MRVRLTARSINLAGSLGFAYKPSFASKVLKLAYKLFEGNERKLAQAVAENFDSKEDHKGGYTEDEE